MHHDMKDHRRFFHNGIRFECQGDGKCCLNHGRLGSGGRLYQMSYMRTDLSAAGSILYVAKKSVSAFAIVLLPVQVYVSNAGSNSVSAVDAESRKELGRIALPPHTGPEETFRRIAVDSDGTVYQLGFDESGATLRGFTP